MIIAYQIIITVNVHILCVPSLPSVANVVIFGSKDL